MSAGDTVDVAALQAELAVAAARIAEQDRQLTALRHETTHDELTGVLNRKGLAEAWHVDVDVWDAVGLIDLDRFKAINDSFGHAAGDQVLIHVTQDLALRYRVVARLGGDELVIIDSKGRIADLLHNPLTWAVPLPGGPLQVTGTVGITRAVSSLKLTLARGDRAMYRAKGAGRGTTTWWSRETDPDLCLVEQVPVRPAVRQRDIRAGAL